MTGKNVVNFVDGVRYTNSVQRGGINTFFNLNEPGSLQAVEVLRGSNSAQYGSDSLGGTVNLITKTPIFGTDKNEFHGEVNPFYYSTSVPLFTALPSYALFNLCGGFSFNENFKVFVAFENIFDNYYRHPSWGIDGAGRSLFVQYRYKF